MVQTSRGSRVCAQVWVPSSLDAAGPATPGARGGGTRESGSRPRDESEGPVGVGQQSK